MRKKIRTFLVSLALWAAPAAIVNRMFYGHVVLFTILAVAGMIVISVSTLATIKMRRAPAFLIGGAIGGGLPVIAGYTIMKAIGGFESAPLFQLGVFLSAPGALAGSVAAAMSAKPDVRIAGSDRG